MSTAAAAAPPGSRTRRATLALLPLASGAAAWLALPDRNLWPLGLVALGPLAGLAVRETPGRSFLGGFAGGLLLYVLAMPWVVTVMSQYGGIEGPTAVLVALLLHGYLAVYWGVFAWLVARAARHGPGLALLSAPLLWAGLEWLRSWLFSGFPWIPLGLSAWSVPSLVQPAEWIGVYGLSALLACGSCAAAALATPRARPAGLVLLGVLLAGWAAGAVRLGSWDARVAAMPRSLPIGVVQAVVPLEERWETENQIEIERLHAVMTEDLVRQGARAAVWSESSLTVPGGYFGNAEYAGKMSRLTRSLRIPILFGGTSHERQKDVELTFNSAFVVDAKGRLAARYDKQHLVPFGEYVPAQRFLFFAKKLVREVGDFGRGEGPVLVPLQGVQAGVPICYEIIFPEITRGFAAVGAELLVTITNDAWFGKSAAPEQHFAHAVLRAVETRRFVVRCANTGISGLVTPAGRVEARSAIFERALFIAPVEPLRDRTLYVRTGDVVPAAGLLLAAFVALRRPPRV